MTLRLTPRELQYVAHLARGIPAKEAAEIEGVTPATLRNTLLIARARSDARNTQHLVAMAVAEGLVKP